MVEVVHVRRSGTEPAERRLEPASANARAENWLEGFRAKPVRPTPPEMLPAAPTAPPPVVHVMPMWEPSPPQATQPVEEAFKPAAETAAPTTRRPHPAKARTPTERHFADPFADADEGTNCIRCGYLVEAAREKRGLPTCLACS
jgi:hypothetical protein